METDDIKYSLKNRNRKHRGADRHYQNGELFDALVSAINSGETQERVKHGDMHGYYGHAFRARFGLIPPETVLVDGLVMHLQPAFVTTKLNADSDGTVTHKARFFDNTPGKHAQALYENRTGGFSSAIDETVPVFGGFDFVFEPNFSGNRPYAINFDSAARPNALTLDGVLIAEDQDVVMLTEYNEHLAQMAALGNAYRMALDTVARLAQENEQLISAMAAGRDVLDDTGRLPLAVSDKHKSQMERDRAVFRRATLLQPVPPPEVRAQRERELQSPEIQRVLSSFMRGL